MRIATSRDDIEIVAVNDPFVDAKYMVRQCKTMEYTIFCVVDNSVNRNEQCVFSFVGIGVLLASMYLLDLDIFYTCHAQLQQATYGFAIFITLCRLV